MNGETNIPINTGEAPATVAPAGPPPRQELRGRLLQRFEQWLDRMLAEEAPPPGVPEQLLAEAEAEMAGGNGPPDAAADFCAIVSALTGLTGEIRIQGRTFRQLADAIAPLAELPGRLERLETAHLDSSEQLAAVLNHVRRSEATGLPPAKEMLKVLFDLADRLGRGFKTFEDGIESIRSQSPAGWLVRVTGASRRLKQAILAADALRDGYRLTLSRLDAAFHEWGIERIGEAGDMFDPQCMTAIEIEASDDEPEGAVLEVYRSGYTLHGQVLETAQVKVAKEKN